MSRELDHLCPILRPAAFELLARCAARRVWCIVVDTLRTPEEQARYLQSGASKTMNSLHLPQYSCRTCGGLAHAMDAAPILDLNATNVVAAIQWDTKHVAWKIYGQEARRAGLVWGGDWASFPDYSHVQLAGTPLRQVST